MSNRLAQLQAEMEAENERIAEKERRKKDEEDKLREARKQLEEKKAAIRHAELMKNMEEELAKKRQRAEALDQEIQTIFMETDEVYFEYETLKKKVCTASILSPSNKQRRDTMHPHAHFPSLLQHPDIPDKRLPEIPTIPANTPPNVPPQQKPGCGTPPNVSKTPPEAHATPPQEPEGKPKEHTQKMPKDEPPPGKELGPSPSHSPQGKTPARETLAEEDPLDDNEGTDITGKHPITSHDASMDISPKTPTKTPTGHRRFTAEEHEEQQPQILIDHAYTVPACIALITDGLACDAAIFHLFPRCRQRRRNHHTPRHRYPHQTMANSQAHPWHPSTIQMSQIHGSRVIQQLVAVSR